MVHLFWTGGWDSTFRLLQILLEEKKPVQTHYIIDQRRASRTKEMETQQEIRRWLAEHYPYTAELFPGTNFFTLEDIKPDLEISDAYQKIIKRRHIGDQYEWLARYCKQNGIHEMEIGKEKFATFEYIRDYEHFLYPEFEEAFISEPDYESMKKNALVLFRDISMPLRHISKVDMLEISKQKKWLPVMEITWFCFNPVRDRIPCGLCNPCTYVIQNNFAWRIPKHRRVYRAGRLGYRYVKRMLKPAPANP